MKKFLILLVLLLGLSLYGCDEDEPGAEYEPPVEDKTEAEMFTVTFDSAGGSEVAKQRVEKGEKVKKPTDPKKKCGCEFDGWYCGDEKWSFIGYVVTEDITLTAKWVDCFGMTEKERAILEEFVAKIAYKVEYTWADVESIECFSEDEIVIRYKVTLKDGVTKNIDVARELVED